MGTVHNHQQAGETERGGETEKEKGMDGETTTETDDSIRNSLNTIKHTQRDYFNVITLCSPSTLLVKLHFVVPHIHFLS